jgi:hypothetical protein
MIFLSQTYNLTRRPKFRIPNIETRNPKPEPRNPKSETRTPETDTRNLKPEIEIRNPTPEIQKPKSEIRNPERRYAKNEFREDIKKLFQVIIGTQNLKSVSLISILNPKHCT